MPSVELYTCLKTVGMGGIKAGSLMVPFTVDVAGEVFDRTIQVADAEDAALIVIPTDLADFDALYVESDQEVLLELVTALDSVLDEDSYVVTIPANGAFVLGSDISRAVHAAGEIPDPTKHIEALTITNSSGATATVRILAIT